MKVVAVIQTSARSWEGILDLSLKMVGEEPAVSRVIDKVKEIGGVDDIVVAAPSTEENEVFVKIAEEKGVRCLLGANENVIERLLEAAETTKADVIVRVLGQHFLLDNALIQEMIGYFIAGGFDMVQSPEGFSIKRSGEIVRTEALKRARDEIHDQANVDDIAVYQSRPIAYIKCHPDRFRVGVFENVPVYSREKRMADRDAFTEIANVEHIEIGKNERQLASSAVYRYTFIGNFVEDNDIVLDIACGTGYGSKILAGNGSHVVGADYSRIPVSEAVRSTLTATEIMDFCVMDASRLGFKSSTFDKVVSVETLEHIPREAVEDYFSEMNRVLKVGGMFICTTPQNEYGDIPIEPSHEREYSLSEFEDMLGRHFVIQKIYGMRSGVYSDIREGEGMLAVCTKPAV